MQRSSDRARARRNHGIRQQPARPEICETWTVVTTPPHSVITPGHTLFPVLLKVLPVVRSGHMITFTLQNGFVATLRTSGTEPKIKCYAEYCAAPGNRSADSCWWAWLPQVRATPTGCPLVAGCSTASHPPASAQAGVFVQVNCIACPTLCPSGRGLTDCLCAAATCPAWRRSCEASWLLCWTSSWSLRGTS